MVEGNTPDWLPPGFGEEVKVKNGKTIKCYYNVATGKKHYSKKDVLRFAKTTQVVTDEGCVHSSNIEVSVQGKESPEWLPHGWRVEEKLRKNGSRGGASYKIYIDLSTGNKFYSKLAVSRYLIKADHSRGMTEQPKSETRDESFSNPETSLQRKSLIKAGDMPGTVLKDEKSFTMAATESTSVAPPSSQTGCSSVKKSKRKNSFNEVGTENTSADGLPLTEEGCIPGKHVKRKKSFAVIAIESTSADGLPPGWVKEIKISQSGNKTRKDPYYIDPVSGYMFLSKKDALRYIETNNIGSCAITPKRKEIDKFKLNEDNKILDDLNEPILKPDTFLQRETMKDEDITPEKKKRSKHSSVVAAEKTPTDGLPPGWIKEIKTNLSGKKIRKDAYYIDPMSGYMFRSKNDVFRYLKTNDTRSCIIKPKKRELENHEIVDKTTLDNVGSTIEKTDVPLEDKPMIVDKGVIPESRKRKHSLTTVSTESTSADGLPPGWIKEIKTSKSGNKTRKDPFYIDPINSYMFHSKKDALRYLETNDIGKCAIIPKRRKLDDPKLIDSQHLPDRVVGNLEPKTPLQHKSMIDDNWIAETENTNKRSLTRARTPSKQISVTDEDLIPETKTRNKRSLNTHDSAVEISLKLNTPLQHKSMTDEAFIPESKKSRKKSFTMVAIETSSVEGLPPGWIKEIQTSKSGDKIRKDPYYIDPVDGYVFRSKMDVMRYLETNDISSCAIAPKKRDLDCSQLTRNKTQDDSAEEPILKPEIPIQSRSIVDAACITETQKKSQNSSTTVHNVTPETFAGGLPPGWITEIKTRKIGNKIRKDLFYTDPVSGYVFRSKKAVLRFLETNDIGCSAATSKKREATDLNLMQNETPKLSEHYEAGSKPFSAGESNSSGGYSSRAKCRAASKNKISKVNFSPTISLLGKQWSENSNKDILSESTPSSSQPVVAMKTTIKLSNDSSEQGAKAMAEVLAICSIINESFTEEKLPKSRAEKQTVGSRLRPRKSKQRRDLNLPSRASMRLSRSEPEMISNLDLNESALSSSVKRSLSPLVPLSSDLDQEKSIANHAPIGEEILVEVPSNKIEELHPKKKSILERAALHEIEKLFSEEIIFEKEPLNEVEKNLTTDNSVLIEQDKEKIRDMQHNDDAISQKPRPCYAFGESWTDPCLEFAYKTLTGEIPIEDGLSFPGIPCDDDDGSTGTKESELPTTVESDIPPGFESMKRNNTAEKMSENSPSSLTASTTFQIDEIPPGFESVAQNKTVEKLP